MKARFRSRLGFLLFTILLPAWTSYAWCGWRTISANQGLVAGTVVSMLEDHSENLWFATDAGVSRFDGSWRTFGTADGLADVLCILEAPAGVFWFGTNGGGVSRFDGSTWRTYTTVNGLCGDDVRSMLRDRSGYLWFGTGGGVSRFDGSTWRNFTTADGLGGNRVQAMLEDRSGNLWFGTGQGVSRYDGSSWRTFTIVDGLGHNDVLSLLEDHSGNIWVGTYTGGVSRYDGATWRAFNPADGLAGNVVTAIAEDQLGDVWFGTDGGGVSRYNGVAWRTYTTADGLANNSVRSIMRDRSGNLWFGTHPPAVSRFDGSTWHNFTGADGLASDYVEAMLTDGSGNLWFTTAVGVSRHNDAGWRTFTTADGLPANELTPLGTDRSGNLWFVDFPGSIIGRIENSSWRTVFIPDELPSSNIQCMLEDRSGNLWFGTFNVGILRYDGSQWQIFSDGINDVVDILEDRAGNIWCVQFNGVSRYDGSTWHTFTTADGLPNNRVGPLLEDRSGNIWTRTSGGGVSRYDGSTWRTFTTADGLASDDISSMLVDRAGNLWFATNGAGLSCYDGSTWRTITVADGLGSNYISSILEDRSGNLWVVMQHVGVSRFDGSVWRTFTEALDGLRDDYTLSMVEDGSGNLWFKSFGGGVVRHEPDRVPPQTIFVNAPPRQTPARDQAAAFAALLSEDQVGYSYRLDGGSWSAWSGIGSWSATGLPDGIHTLEVRSRDFVGNMDPTPAKATFELDATPPAPIIASPRFGQPVSGRIEVSGEATDTRFVGYRLEVRADGAPSWNPPEATVLSESSIPVSNGLLGSWDTSFLPDGFYELRLSVTDSLGLTGAYPVSVIVDNHAPFADVTTPVSVSAASGGDVFTTNSEVHLYFPPRAFRRDALVTITRDAAGIVPDTLTSGAVLASRGFEIAWGAAPLEKPARLEASRVGVSAFLASAGPGATLASGMLALYHSPDGTTWTRLGGTVNGDRVEAPITQAGRYALFVDAGVVSGRGTLSGLSFTPRVFSPTGTFADREVGIGFTLGRPAPVTVRIYSRNGRLVREVATGEAMGVGANLVRWDGRDRRGGFVTDGLYLVTVEALGQTQRKTLAVVR